MSNQVKIYDLEIFAGPCSITEENADEVINKTAKITTSDGKRAIFGTRVVGLKSRTALPEGDEGMGIDYPEFKRLFKLSPAQRLDASLPSIELAEKIVKATGMTVSSEIMIPHIQLPLYAKKKIFQNNFLPWNPAVAQLGWNLYEMSEFSRKNNWHLGIKHGKFLGKDPLEVANHPDYKGETSLEKVWIGLTTYVRKIERDLVLIHRGVDVPGRGNYRNAVVHEIARRVKPRVPGARMYLDATHSVGPVMRHRIMEETIAATKMRCGDGFLYDGLLIESASSSPVDIKEHLTLQELQEFVNEVSKFRKLREPKT